MQIYYLILYFFTYGVLGWCTEVAYAAVKERRFVNRGFLNGPICPIYGVGVSVVLYFLTPAAEHMVLLYIASTVLVTVLEGLTGYDYGVFSLDTNIGDSLGYFGWTTSATAGQTVQVLGYPDDKPQFELWLDGGQLESVGDLIVPRIFLM